MHPPPRQSVTPFRNDLGTSKSREKKQTEVSVPRPDISTLPRPRYRDPDSPFAYSSEPVELSALSDVIGRETFSPVGSCGFRGPRLGQLRCPHGSIATPNFIFCGTKANVKGMSSTSLRTAHSDIVLANTYHLMLRPGADLIEQQGGLHRFMRWDGPLLSDSGGYQVFAMGHGSISEEIKGRRQSGRKKSPQDLAGRTSDYGAKLLKISELGVEFRSYLDGAKVFLSPESSVAVQRQLGVDFMVQFDECTPYHVSRDYTEASMEMSLRWGERSLAEFIAGDDGSQAIYGVVQGGVYPDLRRRSAAGVAAAPFFGSAIGGCLGKSRSQMWQVSADTAPLLPPERPVHLLGIGHIADIFWGVLQGIDSFDCVHPTRQARHGCAILPYACGYSEPGLQAARLNLRQSRFQRDSSPLLCREELFAAGWQDAALLLDLPDELGYSKSYVQHLLRSGEMLGAQLLTINNVFQMNALMRDLRLALHQDCFAEVLRYWLGLSVAEFLAAGRGMV